MGLNMGKLKNFSEDLKNRSEGGGGKTFLKTKDLKEENDVRLLPTKDNLEGMYFMEKIVFWINGKPYLSNETFGEECIMARIYDEVEKAAKAGDKDLKKLLEAKKNGMPVIQRKSSFLIPLLLLNPTFENDNATDPECLEELEVVDDCAKVLECGPQLLNAIHKLVTSRMSQNGTDWGILDRERGRNLVLTKTGKGIDTEYGAMLWPYEVEMDESWYTDDVIPDVYEMVEKQRKSNEYLESVINNYFYGDEIIEDENAGNDSDEEEEEEKPKKPARSGRSTAGARRKPAAKKKAFGGKSKKDEEVSGEEEETPKRAKAGGSRGRSLVDDLEAADD